MPVKTVYEGYRAAKQQFLVNTADLFQASVYYANRRVAPSLSTLTVYMPSSSAKLIDGAGMTIGADGVMSFSITSQSNALVGADYKAVIDYVYSGQAGSVTLFYDVVRARLTKVITDDDLTAELPQLKDAGWQVRGAADSGTVTTIVDAELKRYEDDYFTGGVARLLGKDEAREITGFNSSTGTVTTIPFGSAITTDKYVLTRSYSREIQRAFEKIEEKIVRQGRRPERILDPGDLRGAHILYAVAEVCKGLVGDSKGLWWDMWKEYEKKADDAFEGLTVKYDSTNDGYIAGGERGARASTLRAGRR